MSQIVVPGATGSTPLEARTSKGPSGLASNRILAPSWPLKAVARSRARWSTAFSPRGDQVLAQLDEQSEAGGAVTRRLVEATQLSGIVEGLV